MRKYLIFTLLGIILSSFYMVNEVNADSEFFVHNTKGSYNLGCELDNSCFKPYIVNILVGDTVTWTNNDDAIHVVVSGAPNSESFKDFEDGEIFDSGFLKSNESFSHTFIEEGIFGYFCTLHPWMNGFVTVGDVEFIEPSMDADFKTLPILPIKLEILPNKLETGPKTPLIKLDICPVI